jgi:hypothetical protein
VQLLDLRKGDIDRQHGPALLLSRSNGYRPTTCIEPARLLPRLHHQARGY